MISNNTLNNNTFFHFLIYLFIFSHFLLLIQLSDHQLFVLIYRWLNFIFFYVGLSSYFKRHYSFSAIRSIGLESLVMEIWRKAAGKQNNTWKTHLTQCYLFSFILFTIGNPYHVNALLYTPFSRHLFTKNIQSCMGPQSIMANTSYLKRKAFLNTFRLTNVSLCAVRT